MPGSEGRWAELSSQHERCVQPGEQAGDNHGGASTAARSQWAELASQSERLLDKSDPLFRLASSSHTKPGMRLVARTAA